MSWSTSTRRNRGVSEARRFRSGLGRRSTWAAIGAAVAVVLGAGSAMTWVAATSSEPSSFVSITPVRILDTRTGLGLMGMFGAGVGRELQVTGPVPTPTGTRVIVPAGATAVVLNVTAVEPTADGFVSVRPAGTPGEPTTSNLNVRSGDVVPNSVTVAVPTAGAVAGRIEIFYGVYQARIQQVTHVLVDVMGYYVAGGAGGDVGPAGPAGPAAWDPIPSGVTVVGYAEWDLQASGAGDFAFSVTLPGRARSPLSGETVNFAPYQPAPSRVIDPDPTCTGSFATPTAPAGKVCVYLGSHARVANLFADAPAVASDVIRTTAFRVFFVSPAGTAVNDDVFLRVTWAYTAP